MTRITYVSKTYGGQGSESLRRHGQWTESKLLSLHGPSECHTGVGSDVRVISTHRVRTRVFALVDMD